MSELFQVECPCCHAMLWVDPSTRTVAQHKRSEKKVHSSLEELLEKESAKREKTDERFLQAKKLDEAKKQQAEQLFHQSLKDKP
ncbi:MAG TPA: hypothetical protein PKK12_06350 [Candidatus Aminicenantes bacterium]|nr:hypothetical protein [Candidatus Aminicenantes bacterium]